jgi:hypothetical protein
MEPLHYQELQVQLVLMDLQVLLAQMVYLLYLQLQDLVVLQELQVHQV